MSPQESKLDAPKQGTPEKLLLGPSQASWFSCHDKLCRGNRTFRCSTKDRYFVSKSVNAALSSSSVIGSVATFTTR